MINHKDMNKLDIIAVEMAKAIKPPDTFVSNEETEKSHKAWADKCYRMAIALIKRGNLNE